MRLCTIREAATALDVPEQMLRRAVRERRLAFVEIGNRTLINLADAERFVAPYNAGVLISDVVEATGLSDSAVRRGIREGWLPAQKVGRAYRFDMDAVREALRKRLDESLTRGGR